MTDARTEISETTILASIHPMDHNGTPIYVIRNRIAQDGRHGAPGATVVRKALSRLESLGRVVRTKATRPNEVRWAIRIIRAPERSC